jgi:hypothetical protein
MKDRADETDQRSGGEHGVSPFLAGQVFIALERRKYATGGPVFRGANSGGFASNSASLRVRERYRRHAARRRGHGLYQAMTL